MIQFVAFTPCPDKHPDDHKGCERPIDHEPPHWYTVWETMTTEDGLPVDSWPAFPVTWGADE